MSSNLMYPRTQFQVQEQIFDPKALVDEENFYHQRQGMPSELTKSITYILGSYKKNYPISLMTTGGEAYGNTGTSVELEDVQFTYPVMARRTKASVVYSTEYSGSDQPGYAHAKFYITFTDNWIKRYYILQSEHGNQVYVHSDGESVSGGYRYEVQLDPAGPTDFCPLSELLPGTRWAELNTAVAESESRSTESKTVMPGLFKNQMGFQRAGISWAGNTANRIMKINIKMDGGETDVWMDYIMWQFEERWLEEKEHLYWYSRYNRMLDGTVGLKDMLTGKIIPRGSGILEQITNKATYSQLTYNVLVNKIGDALFGQTDTAGMDITLITGTGGRREFHNALISAGATYLSYGSNVADKFVTGSGYNLMLGGYFDGFYHIDGYTIKLKHNPVFDTGRIAQISPLHPKTGLPLESYRMVFIDNAEVDGQPNLRHVVQKGRAFIDGVSNGLSPMPASVKILLGGSGGEASKYLSSVQDKSEYTRMSSGGIQLMRGNRCFDLQCIAGQAATYYPM